MKKSILTLAAALALTVGASSAHAANSFVFQWDDLGDSIHGITYENGVVIQDANIGGESYGGSYGLGWDPSSFLASDVDVAFNIYGAGEGLSDTWHIFGNAGDAVIQIPFNSDVEGQTLTPLVNAISLKETGQFQTVLQFTLTNGDDYTWQFRSDVESGVPEPATWALMLGGFGLAGVALRRRRMAVA